MNFGAKHFASRVYKDPGSDLIFSIRSAFVQQQWCGHCKLKMKIFLVLATFALVAVALSESAAVKSGATVTAETEAQYEGTLTTWMKIGTNTFRQQF